MNKFLIIVGFAIAIVLGDINMFSQSMVNNNKNRYAKPALPYGPKNQEPWYKPRGFEESDFQEQSYFEFQRQETENLRQVVQPRAPEDELHSNLNDSLWL